MGNDRRYVEVEDLPFRLIDIPIGSAPPGPSSPLRTSHKLHAPPIPPPRIDGYDAPPSLRPPPSNSPHYDQPIPPVPPRADLPRTNVHRYREVNSPKRVHYHRKKHSKSKLNCCVVS